MKIINFFGSPCAGKSTAASGLFNEMKRHNYRCEYVTEVAKDYIYDGSAHILSDQLLILAEQCRRINRLLDKNIDYAITDAPVLFSSFYALDSYPECFHELCLHMFKKHENINIFVHRTHPYNNLGRVHNEDQSNAIAQKMHAYLINNAIPFVDITAKNATSETLLQYIKSVEQ